MPIFILHLHFYTLNRGIHTILEEIKFDLTLQRPAQNCIHWPYIQDQLVILQVFLYPRYYT